MSRRRRGRGEGSVYRRKDGSWCGILAVELTPPPPTPRLLRDYGSDGHNSTLSGGQVQQVFHWDVRLAEPKVQQDHTASQGVEAGHRFWRRSGVNQSPTSHT